MRALQGVFGRLCVPLDVNDSKGRKEILECCIRLHNVQTIWVGVNQMRTVYMPEWEVTNDERFWEELGNAVFSDFQRCDHVARFHLVVVDA
jgi:hypothetical protein